MLDGKSLRSLQSTSRITHSHSPSSGLVVAVVLGYRVPIHRLSNGSQASFGSAAAVDPLSG